MNHNHKVADRKYQNLRELTYQITEEELPYQDSLCIRLGEISEKAIFAFDSAPTYSERKVYWDWKLGVRTYRRRYPDRFELAIWYNSTLCGLSIGRPSYAGTRMRLDFIERVPGANNPLKGRVTPISVTAYEVYARLIDAKQVRIMFPENDLVEYYSSLDFVYVKGTGTDMNPSYLYKNL